MPVMAARAGGCDRQIASTSGIRWTGSRRSGMPPPKRVSSSSAASSRWSTPQGIRVNTVVPGQLHTPLVDARLAGSERRRHRGLLGASGRARIPMPFMGDGRDTANAALFLASDEARFVTGAEIVVDGGMSARCD